MSLCSLRQGQAAWLGQAKAVVALLFAQDLPHSPWVGGVNGARYQTMGARHGGGKYEFERGCRDRSRAPLPSRFERGSYEVMSRGVIKPFLVLEPRPAFSHGCGEWYEIWWTRIVSIAAWGLVHPTRL